MTTGRRRADFHNQLILDVDLRPGDVLLSHGGRRKSNLICLIDGGDYSHASLWDGRHVVEATGAVLKVHRCELRELVEHTRYVDAFRPTWGGHPLGTNGLSAEPILRVAHDYVDQRYSYGQLYLIGTLLAAGRLSGHPKGQWIFHQICDELTRALRKIEDRGPDDQPMVCSHYVSRCFWEADSSQARRYGLRVRLRPSGFWRKAGNGAFSEHPGRRRFPDEIANELDADVQSRMPGWSSDEIRAYRELQASCRRLLLGDPRPVDGAFDWGGESNRVFGTRHIEVTAGDAALPVVSVSPGHLQHSPTLEYLGVVSEPPRDDAWTSAPDEL